MTTGPPVTARPDLFGTKDQAMSCAEPAGRDQPQTGPCRRQTLIAEEGRLWLYPDAFAGPENCCQALIRDLDWQQHEVRIAGRRLPSPRLSAWHGEPGANYAYSGLHLEPQPWTRLLQELRQQLETLLETSFNSVLANLYRDGRDSMGWHSDDEPELGAEPLIASLSFGAARNFRLRHRRHPKRQHTIRLENGSLLVMAGALQQHWRHCLPRSARVHEARVNLSFRQVRLAQQPCPRKPARP